METIGAVVNSNITEGDEVLAMDTQVKDTLYTSENEQIIDEKINRICETTKDRLKEVMRYFDDSYFKLADAIGISYQSLSKKLNNHVDFKRSEILKIKYRYNLDAEQIDYIFFSEG